MKSLAKRYEAWNPIPAIVECVKVQDGVEGERTERVEFRHVHLLKTGGEFVLATHDRIIALGLGSKYEKKFGEGHEWVTLPPTAMVIVSMRKMLPCKCNPKQFMDEYMMRSSLGMTDEMVDGKTKEGVTQEMMDASACLENVLGYVERHRHIQSVEDRRRLAEQRSCAITAFEDLHRTMKAPTVRALWPTTETIENAKKRHDAKEWRITTENDDVLLVKESASS